MAIRQTNVYSNERGQIAYVQPQKWSTITTFGTLLGTLFFPSADNRQILNTAN